GTRPRLDAGVLGVALVERPPQEWTTQSFELAARQPVAAGIDGEAVRLEPPLRFSAHPAALRVRIARAHPGASPSALEPDGVWPAARALAAIAARRSAMGP
ncbi:MAG: hypothetical protein QOF26_1804, partial [Baekduia sp.]|nr:hypothetical protein [Baekduia sp.]